MKTRRFLTILWVFTLALNLVWAQAPNNSGDYYKDADGKKGAALKTAMFNVIKISKAGWTYDGLKTAYMTTDTRTDGYLRDWYSNATSYTPGSACAGSYSAEGDGYNREHLVPQSWFDKKSPMVSDIFHVVPSDAKINNERGDKPLGEVGTTYNQSKNGYSKWGQVKSGLVYDKDNHPVNSLPVFEPNNEVKGDIARAYFYMVTCYEDKISKWNSAVNASYVFDGNTYPGLTNWCLQMMIRWSAIDPVDEIEVARNNVIAAKQNRNPFIDYPGLEKYIWGDWQDVAFSYDHYVNPYGGENPPVTVSIPTFSPAGGTYISAQNVTISCSTSGATIYYTTNGSTPTASSTVYSSAISISETTTLKAIAIKDGTSSNVATATYTISSGGDPTPVTGDGIFKKVLSTSELESGKRYIIVSGTHALTKLDGKAGSGSVMISSSQIDMNNSSNTALILTMEKDGNDWTIKSDDGYMALTSNSNTLNSSMTATENTAKWKVSVSSGTASVINVNYSGRSLKYNTSNDMFRCYTSGQADVEIYKEMDPTTTPGDVVKDGDVTFADLKALVKILLGIDTSGDGEIDENAADVNEDGKTNIADVTKLVNLLLKK